MSKKGKSKSKTGTLMPKYPFSPNRKAKYWASEKEIEALKSVGGWDPKNPRWDAIRFWLFGAFGVSWAATENLSITEIVEIVLRQHDQFFELKEQVGTIRRQNAPQRTTDYSPPRLSAPVVSVICNYTNLRLNYKELFYLRSGG